MRNLEREIGKVLAQGRDEDRVRATSTRARSTIDARATCASYLGRQKFFFEAAERTAVPGVATGLAVTGIGGDVLFIEATAMDGAEAGERPDAHRAARRRDEGVGADRAVATCGRTRPSSASTPATLHAAVPRARAGGRGAQGRPERRRHDDDGAGRLLTGTAGRADRRHDRRGHAAGPRAADRRASSRRCSPPTAPA